MKKEQVFMMIFRITPNFKVPPTAEEQARMSAQWGKFIGQLAIQEKLVSTHRLGFEGIQLQADQSSIIEEALSLEKQTVSGNMVVKANTLEEVVQMAKDCPIFHIGGSVEIRNILPMES